MHSKILLTGATGMLGGEVALLLANSGCEVYCLTKGFDPQERLLTRLRKSKYFIEGVSDKNIYAEPGDLRLEGLGLCDSSLETHLKDIDLIVHSAAETSFLNKESCREVNINGTQRVVNFASKCKNKPLICYISTACNVGAVTNTCLKEEEGCKPEAVHHNEYTRSKAISETIVRQSGLPFLIVRPSIVLSDSIDDRVFARQIFWFVPLMWKFSAIPINEHSRTDVVPVSFFAESLLKLLQSPRSHDCYNISSGTNSFTFGQWSEIARQILGRESLPEFVKPELWNAEKQKQCIATPEQKKLFSGFKHYLPFWNMNVVFDNTKLEETIGELKIPLPETYLKHILDLITAEEAIEESQAP
jgi:nucleoside-diphosphate-sugar epimerase